MGQFGFFDADKRLAVISAKGDPLIKSIWGTSNNDDFVVGDPAAVA